MRPLTRRQFARRVAAHFALATALVAVSLAGGMWGYEYYEALGWRDAFMNTAMLLGGMGPVHTPVTDGGRVFAGCFALYAGLVFLVVAGLVLAPIVHRLMHRLHWDAEDSGRPR
jgi:hypothetical protein